MLRGDTGRWAFLNRMAQPSLPMNLASVGTSRCDVPAGESAGGIVAPRNAARTAQRAVPTRFRGSMREVLFRGNLSWGRGSGTAVELSPSGFLPLLIVIVLLT